MVAPKEHARTYKVNRERGPMDPPPPRQWLLIPVEERAEYQFHWWQRGS